MRAGPDVPMSATEMVVDFALVLLLLALVFALIRLGAWMGLLPGQVADARGHPHSEAIKIASWFGLALLGPLWVVALIWAHVKPTVDEDVPASDAPGKGGE